MVMEINGAIASVGAGAACLDHPYNAVQWLARTLASRGEPLRAGDIVLSGSLGPMVAIKTGDHGRIRVGGVGTTAEGRRVGEGSVRAGSSRWWAVQDNKKKN